MWQYYLFAFGWGLLQAAYDRMPVSEEPGTPARTRKQMQSPLWMGNEAFGATAAGIATAGMLVVPIVGFAALSWWHGLLGFAVTRQLVTSMTPTTNPVWPLGLGLISTVAGATFLLLS